MDHDKCVICNEIAAYANHGNPDICNIQCPRCGCYNVTRTAMVKLCNEEHSPKTRATMSGWLRENQNCTISSNKIEELLNARPPKFTSKSDKFLCTAEENASCIGDRIKIYPPALDWLGKCWAYNFKEIVELFRYLEEIGRVTGEISAERIALKITPAGWIHLESLKEINPNSEQGFVAMAFAVDIKPIYELAIEPAIKSAGYSPLRIDKKEHTGRIDDEIIMQIRRSRFVVADLTGHRANVYYELGFAHGLGLQVFFTCRNEDFNTRHFDIQQYNCIRWDENSPEEFKTALAYRIEAVLGRGPVK